MGYIPPSVSRGIFPECSLQRGTRSATPKSRRPPPPKDLARWRDSWSLRRAHHLPRPPTTSRAEQRKGEGNAWRAACEAAKWSAGEGDACCGAAVGAMADDEPRRCTHTSRGAGEDESAAAHAGERALLRRPPWPPSSSSYRSLSSSTAPQAGEGWMEQGRRARPRARIRRARGSRAPNRAAEHRIEPLLFPRGEREQRNEAPGRRAAAGVRREDGVACFPAPLDP
jgi:hypothetical protein